MSFVVQPTSAKKWMVKKIIYKEGKAARKALDSLAYITLGFDKERMTIDEAKARARALNLQNRIEKHSQLAIVNAARRLSVSQAEGSVYLPTDTTNLFLEHLNNNYISRQKFGHKMTSHWQKATEVITALKLLPKDFSANKNSIVNYFVKKTHSLDYTKKVVRLIDLWGQFYSESNLLFYKHIPPLDNLDAQLITDSYCDSASYIGPSEPLSPGDLDALKGKLSDAQYRWLYISVWCGLRPSEINHLKAKVNGHRVEYKDRTPILVVYQSKLVRVARDKRVKRIPLFLDEQKIVLEYLGFELDQPLVKTIRKYLNRKVGLYGGRKGFTDLMLSRGQKFENISAWLGHANIDRTWRSYKDKRVVSFDVVSESKPQSAREQEPEP